MDIERVVPPRALAAFLDGVLEGSHPVEVSPLGQGRSNLTFRVVRDGVRYVLRRPPEGDIPETAHDMGREHTVLSALTGADVRTPDVVAMCDDTDVIGVPFFVMEEVAGRVIRDTTPAEYTEEDRHRVGLEMVDALAELHTVDVDAVGLGDLGKPGYTARQVRRWTRQLEQMATRDLPDLDAVRGWLEERVPETHPRAIVHGDFKLDNALFSEGSPATLRAILDWEMATVGDPLADLGYLLVFWPEPDEPGLAGFPLPSAEGGYATKDELIARYTERTGFVMEDLTMYRVLALWKLAILTEGLYKRFLAGKAHTDWYRVLEDAVPQMAAQSREWAGI